MGYVTEEVLSLAGQVFCYPQHPDWLWGPPTLLFAG